MKYIIELEDEPMIANSFNQEVDELWKAKGFNSLVFDKYGLYKLTPYTETDRKAIEDEVWEFVRELIHCNNGKGMTDDELQSCFGYDLYSQVFKQLSYQDVKAKYDEWKSQKEELHIGDEVIYNGDHVVITDIFLQDITRLWIEGVTSSGKTVEALESDIKKTGRHFAEIEELLKKLGGE